MMRSNQSSNNWFESSWMKILLYSMMSMVISQSIYAKGLLKVAEDPKGKVEYAAKTLDAYDVGENTEKHLKANAVFNLWIQDETFFKPMKMIV